LKEFLEEKTKKDFNKKLKDELDISSTEGSKRTVRFSKIEIMEQRE